MLHQKDSKNRLDHGLAFPFGIFHLLYHPFHNKHQLYIYHGKIRLCRLQKLSGRVCKQRFPAGGLEHYTLYPDRRAACNGLFPVHITSAVSKVLRLADISHDTVIADDSPGRIDRDVHPGFLRRRRYRKLISDNCRNTGAAMAGFRLGFCPSHNSVYLEEHRI